MVISLTVISVIDRVTKNSLFVKGQSHQSQGVAGKGSVWGIPLAHTVTKHIEWT
jgi:hypothetical protein